MAHRAIHSDPTPSKNIFMNFLEKLPTDKKKKFLRALHEDEIMRFSSSEEEFRMITGKEMPTDFPGGFKPLRAKESDVDEEAVKKDIQERFDEIEDAFPNSIEDLKDKANEGDGPFHPEMSMDKMRAASQPSISVSISIQNIKEKAGNSTK